MIDIVIVGAGTAGLSAAIYGLRAGKKVLLLEEKAYGGQIVDSPEIENYPGISKVSGVDFATALYQQAIDLGAEIKYEKVVSAKVTEHEKQVQTTQGQYSCKTIILATGVKRRPLGLLHEKEWIGAGISYCAVCDGAFYKGKEVAVAGGGNTALEDAAYLANHCKKVYLVHRRNQLRGEERLARILEQKENVEYVWNVEIQKLVGDKRLEAIEIRDKSKNQTRTIAVSGLFIAIGQIPGNTEFQNLVQLDEAGYIIAGEECRTNIPGIYAAGDCRRKQVRQLTTAAADGSVAAIMACDEISKNH